jgi:ABC-type phosphate transport system auxiliary subunit
MAGSDFVMYDNEFQKIDEELQRLHQQAMQNVVFLVDKNGQLIAEY